MKDIKIRDICLFFLFLATGIAGLPGDSGGAAADLVLRGGPIYTNDPDRPTVASVAIRDGRIAYLGPVDGLAPHLGRRTRVVELGARSAYPGFVDARTSLYRQGLVRGFVDLTESRDFDEALRRMARAVRQAPPNRWVVGWGWDQNRWFKPEFPASLPLESVSMGRALVLFNRGLSAAVLNSSALGQAGVDREIPDPPGGRFLRFKGNPTGCLADRALDLVWNVLPQPTPGDIEGFYRAGADSAARLGWTAVHEVSVGPAALAALERLGQEGRPLPIRIYGIMDSRAFPDSVAVRRGPPRPRPGSRIEIGGLLWQVDGDFSTRGAALEEPYTDESWNRGSLGLTTEELIPGLQTALEAGWQPVLEASGDLGINTALAALDSVLTALPASRRTEVRPRLLRATLVPPTELPRLARLGVAVTALPGRLPDQMGWIENRLGLGRAAGLMAWRSLRETQLSLAFGSDAPSGPANPLQLFHAAITRRDPMGRQRGGWRADEALSRAEALVALSAGAAHSGGARAGGTTASTGRGEEGAGTLAIGRPADLTILSADIMTVPESEILKVAAVMTIVDGTVAWEQR